MEKEKIKLEVEDLEERIAPGVFVVVDGVPVADAGPDLPGGAEGGIVAPPGPPEEVVVTVART